MAAVVRSAPAINTRNERGVNKSGEERGMRKAWMRGHEKENRATSRKMEITVITPRVKKKKRNDEGERVMEKKKPQKNQQDTWRNIM